MSSHTYRDSFYRNRERQSRQSAKPILNALLEHIPLPASAIDLGCGTGAWLQVLKELGIKKVHGYEGPWVPRKHWSISAEEMTVIDLAKEMPCPEKHDLALSIEVAEHLSESRAPHFVHSLASAADYILFSAAIPFQKGRGHMNEQWPSYWANLFRKEGFLPFNFLRERFWKSTKIRPFLRQNIVLYVKDDKAATVSGAQPVQDPALLDVVHPSHYNIRVKQLMSFSGGFKSALRSLVGLTPSVKVWAPGKPEQGGIRKE